MRIGKILLLSSMLIGFSGIPAHAANVSHVDNASIFVLHEETAPGPEAQMTLDQAVHSASSKLTSLHPDNFSISLKRTTNVGTAHLDEKSTETRLLAPFGFTQKSKFLSADDEQKTETDDQKDSEETVSDQNGHKVGMSPIGKRWDTYAVITGYGKGQIDGRLISVVTEQEGTILHYQSFPFTLKNNEAFSKTLDSNPLFPDQGKVELQIQPHWG